MYENMNIIYSVSLNKNTKQQKMLFYKQSDTNVNWTTEASFLHFKGMKSYFILKMI